jgi:hypothetical protein
MYMIIISYSLSKGLNFRINGLFGIDDLEKREIKKRELEEKSGISHVWESKETSESDIKCVDPTPIFLLL